MKHAKGKNRVFGGPKKETRMFAAVSSGARAIQKMFTPAPNPVLPKEAVVHLPSDILNLGIESADTIQSFVPWNDTVEAACPSGVTIKSKAKRYENSDSPLLTWRDGYRQEYLDLSLELEGRGRFWIDGDCCTCAITGQNALYRCQDCSFIRNQCRECILVSHRSHPLHVIERWNRLYFERTTLASLGLRVQLGHPSDNYCPFPQGGHKDFVVIHLNGIHKVALSFCGCVSARPSYAQLLETSWWPSTPLEPQTAFTFPLLRTFHTMNLQGRISPTDFYRSIQRIENGDGLKDPPDRLSQFMLVVREWRHTKMAKRAGRGHDPDGVSMTRPGQLSVPCRACPQPNINLPHGWESAPPEIRWIYGLILVEDANFKQKARLWGGNRKDPALGPGWATFVANDAYLHHLVNYVHRDEVSHSSYVRMVFDIPDQISHCVGFAALWKANNKRSKGLRATGIGAVSCARHELFRPNGMGDLQKGEHYANMDYIFLMSIIGTALQLLTMSYDIACQWSIHFFRRMAAMPDHMKPPANLEVRFLVPKFHLPAHVERCYGPFSFNFAKWVGRTDGEGVERNWAWLNGIARCVSMMGPGGRWDTLDDFCNYSNWRKTVNLETSLLRKLTLAMAEAIVHHRAFAAFTDALIADDIHEVQQWEADVVSWETDRTKPCLYDRTKTDVTFSEIKMQLTQEEHRKAEIGDDSVFLAEETPTSFIVAGLDIEEAQTLLGADATSAKTTTQLTSIQRRRTMMLRKIQRFRDVQSAYMPGLGNILPNGLMDPTETPEIIPLHLPSSLDMTTRNSVCLANVASVEDQLRYAKAVECLSELRSQLLKRTLGNKYKAKNEASQRAYTRFRVLLDQTESKIRAAAHQYRTNRKAILSLRGHGAWENMIQVLNQEDVRGMHEKAVADEEARADRMTRQMAGLSEDSAVVSGSYDNNVATVPVNPILALGEGSRTLSWIWYTASKEERGKAELDSAYRLQWLKSRANAARYQEELVLLEEEMRRVIAFCHWKAGDWVGRADQRITTSDWLSEGLAAYAQEQAAAERERASRLTSRWLLARERAKSVLKSLADSTIDVTSFAELVVELGDEEEDGDEENGEDEGH